MKLTLDGSVTVILVQGDSISAKLNKILDTLTQLVKMEEQMSAELDALTNQVQGNSDVIASAVTLINGIADRITAAGTDPVKLKALTKSLQEGDDALAAAIAANTVAAP